MKVLCRCGDKYIYVKRSLENLADTAGHTGPGLKTVTDQGQEDDAHSSPPLEELPGAMRILV